MDVRNQVPLGEGDPSSVVDTYEIRCGRRCLMPVKRRVASGNDRPRVRMSGGFTGKVSRVEFLEGCVEILKVEADTRHDSVVRVRLDDSEHLEVESLRSSAATRYSGSAEREAVAARRDDCRIEFSDTHLDNGP